MNVRYRPVTSAAIGLATALGLGALLVAVPSTNSEARAQESSNPLEMVCSAATLNGSYGFQRHGTKTDGTLLTSVGNITFDGQGNVVGGQQWTMKNGVMTVSVIPAGSYTINADCTGQIIDPTLGPISQLVAVHRGSVLLAMSLSAGNSVWARFDKMADAPGASAVAPVD